MLDSFKTMIDRLLSTYSQAEEIQISSNLPIWVGIMDTKSITLTSETFPILWAELLEELSIQGLNVDEADIFLAGHGSRGSFAVEFGLQESEMLGGIILFGSLLPSAVKSSAFPLPLLTITGELDGLTKITDVARFYRKVREK
ncbi:hypothetical protein LOTGIDRAFT_159263 [Lottia gigantea]|uniref:Uncharacterized protein n=1 Tax=Lottia gigantea TaxID=225164 RepID=V4ATY7_LOTGI|nr:hypothetical protein LOTGIDRAFT_159263 [Lottia gigantea]ESO97241.1 hypothetical protein LOTGIDRAFT_159263 [Lottia gigantea]